MADPAILGFLWAGRDYARTGEYFRQALELARASGDPLTIAQSLNRLGNWLGNTGHSVECLEAHHQALDIFRTQGSQPEMAETHDLLAVGYSFSGDVLAANEQLERAIEIFRRVGDKRGLVSSLAAHSGMVSNCDSLPWPAQTIQTCRRESAEALALAQQIGWPDGQAMVQWLFAVTLAEFGQFGEALAYAGAAQQMATDIEHRQWTAAADCTLGQISVWLLEPETAIHQLEAGQPLAIELGSVWWISYTSAFMALAQLQLGRARAARAKLQSAAATLGLEGDWAAQPPRNLSERQLAWAWGELALTDGQPAEALAAADRLINSAINPAGVPIPNLLKLKGEALIDLGQLPAAQAALALALQGAQEHQARPIEWQIHRDRGRLAQRLERMAEAGREVEAARTIAEALAATLDEGPLRQAFRSRALSQLTENGVAGR